MGSSPTKSSKATATKQHDSVGKCDDADMESANAADTLDALTESTQNAERETTTSGQKKSTRDPDRKLEQDTKAKMEDKSTAPTEGNLAIQNAGGKHTQTDEKKSTQTTNKNSTQVADVRIVNRKPRPATRPTATAKLKRSLVFEQKLETKVPSDKERCWIYGLAVLPGNRLVAVDEKNQAIKLIDTTNGKIINYLSLKDTPLDVAVVSEDTLAVTIIHSKHYILFVNISEDKLTTTRQVAASDKYMGIASYADELYVTVEYGKPGVDVLDLQGNVMKTFERNKAGKLLFESDSPRYITVSNDGNIYVCTNGHRHTITCLNLHGKLQWRYLCVGICEGLEVDKTGTVIMATSHNIHVISSTGKQLQTLKDGSMKDMFLGSMVLSEDQERLYVGTRIFHDEILVYRLLTN